MWIVVTTFRIFDLFVCTGFHRIRGTMAKFSTEIVTVADVLEGVNMQNLSIYE